jgi:RHS repeat-associated protein
VWVYNSRLQPNNIYSTINNQDNQWLFWEQLGWSAPNTTTNDNGILQTAVVSEGGPSIRSQMLVFSQLFGYDMANRLTAAIDTNWVRTFHYDAYGNMSVSANGGAPLNGLTPQWQNNVDPFDPATNRLLAGGYDAAGNQAVFGSLSMWRDAENRQYQTWDSLSNVLVNYLYDSEGRRVQKTVAGGATTDYVYDAMGQLAAEYTGAGAVSKEYIRLGGQLVAIENASGSPCTTCYLSYDYLGSVRLVTDQNANVVARHEYLPFGEALDGWAGRTGSGWGTFDNVNQRFTGQERDSETNLDFFQARYFGAALGRFTSPDPENAGADVTNPQSWNGYSYVANNPLNSIDPSGACDVAIYGLTMNPGESSDVTSFSAGKVAVFPYAGTNLFTGLWQVATGGGEIGAATQAIRSAISQTPAGQSVNIFAFSGGAQTLASAWGQLSSSEQGRIGNITYAIPGSLTGALFNGTLPRGNGNPTILLPSANNEIPGGAPQEPYNVRWETSCGHDVGCIIRKAANFLKAQSATACAASKVFSQSSPKPNGPKGSATSTITYGPVGGFGWDEFDLLNLLSGFGGSTPPDDFQRRISY